MGKLQTGVGSATVFFSKREVINIGSVGENFMGEAGMGGGGTVPVLSHEERGTEKALALR